MNIEIRLRINNMKVIKGEDYSAVSKIVADIIADEMVKDPECVLGLATGSTPEGVYKELIDKYEAGEIDFSKVKTVNLDEYKGLSGDNDQSYRYFMNTHLFDHVNIDKENTFVPNGLELDSQKACQDYEECLQKVGQPDIQILGLGLNGHIGFNEPAEEFSELTNCVDLTESTIEANSRFFDSINEVPKQAYTMGIGSIMRAKKIVLVVTGEKKRDILKKSFSEEVTPWVPASILQNHRDVVLVGDVDALGDNF